MLEQKFLRVYRPTFSLICLLHFRRLFLDKIFNTWYFFLFLAIFFYYPTCKFFPVSAGTNFWFPHNKLFFEKKKKKDSVNRKRPRKTDWTKKIKIDKNNGYESMKIRRIWIHAFAVLEILFWMTAYQISSFKNNRAYCLIMPNWRLRWLWI